MPADPLPDMPLSGNGHFVVRFSPPEHRDRLSAVFAFASELEKSVARCTDPGVTRLKLDWWRQELASAGSSRHPLIRRLAPLALDPQGLAAMQAMLDAAEADVHKQQPDDIPTFHAHCDRAGSLAGLLCLACGHQASGAGPLGRYVAAVHRIQHLGRRLRQDHQPLPRELGLPPDSRAWDDARLAEACRVLLDPLWQSAEPVLRKSNAATLPARRWASQARAVHRLLEREGYPVQRMLVDITPFRRLWTAWRVR